MVDDADKSEPMAEKTRWRLVVGQFMADDAQDGVDFARLTGPWRVKVDGDELFAEFSVTESVRTELTHSPDPAAQRTHLETRHA